MEDSLHTNESPLSSENLVQTYIDRAAKIVANRYETVSVPVKEASLKLLNRRRLPLALLTAFIIASAGCGNTENPVDMPIFGEETTMVAGTPTPPEVRTTPTPSATDKLKYKDHLPADIVSEKELWEKYHTKIWNTDNVKLHLRRAALVNEPIFEDLQRTIAPQDKSNFIFTWNSETLKLEDRPLPYNAQLDVVLIPGRMNRSINMTEEQKRALPELYGLLRGEEARAWEAAKRQIAEKASSYIPELNKSIQKAEAELREGKILKESYEFILKKLNQEIAAYTEDLARYNFDTFYDKYGFMPNHKAAAGLYVGRYEDADFDEKGNAVAIRQKYYITVGVPESGIDGSLDPEKSSFFDPATFKMEHDPEYPLKVPFEAGISKTIRHEFTHYDTNHPYTDYVHLERYTRAYDKFMEGDDSLFYFVFETPRGNVVAERSDSGLL